MKRVAALLATMTLGAAAFAAAQQPARINAPPQSETSKDRPVPWQKHKAAEEPEQATEPARRAPVATDLDDGADDDEAGKVEMPNLKHGAIPDAPGNDSARPRQGDPN